jgi:pyruvate dehydrogenase E2 component (dihydrolipoamide acetyltransferase)
MDILMPQLGETVTEGKITAWFKSIGESVGPGDNLFEIETDKVSMEVPATAAGVLTEIRVAAGEAAPVGAVVAVLGGRAAGATPSPPPRDKELRLEREGAVTSQIAAPQPQARSETNGAAPARITLDPFREVRTPERNYGPARLASGVVTTPLARRLAGQAGIDLAGVSPTGPHGRIIGRDVERAIAGGADLAARGQTQIGTSYAPGSYEEIPLDVPKRANAAHLVEAARVPQFRLTADIAVGRLEQVREEANASALSDQAGKAEFYLALDDFIVRALALALARVPAANAVWTDDRILRFKQSDIAVALAAGGGLALPVIRGAERKPLLDISAERQHLAGKARSGNLAAAELQGGASAVCSLAASGVRAFDLMVMPPHSSMLAVGAPARRPIETADGGFRFTTIITVTLSCDQRVIDAVLGAELLGALRHFIEHPVGLMI